MKIRETLRSPNITLPPRDNEFQAPSANRIKQAMALAQAAGAPLPAVKITDEEDRKAQHFDTIRKHRENRAQEMRGSNGRDVPGPARSKFVDEEQDAEEAHAKTYVAPMKKTSLADKLRTSTATAPIESSPQVRVASELSSEWIRQDFPSHHLSYAGKDIFCRILDIPSMAKLSAAVKNKSFTMFLDAIDSCINVDIRTLTPSDLTFFMYWLRLESFPTLSITFPWRSKYGDELETKINRTDLEIKEIEMTAEEYATYTERGYRMPTVRDMELLEDTGLSDEDRFRLELAQYVQGDEEFDPATYISSKLEALDALGVSAYLDIQSFSQKIVHGVVETVTVVNHKFKPENAIAFFEETATGLTELITIADKNSEVDGNESALIAIGARIKDLQDVIGQMRADLAAGKPIVAEKEVIAISINAMTFFPSI